MPISSGGRGGQRAKGEREKKAALFRRRDDDDGDGDADGVRVTWKRATLAPAMSFARRGRRTRGPIKSSNNKNILNTYLRDAILESQLYIFWNFLMYILRFTLLDSRQFNKVLSYRR